jgi:DNA polymerase-3 subunit beta
MRLTISQRVLADALARGGSVAVKKPTVAILAYTRLIAGDGTLAVATSDHDRFAEARCDAEVQTEGSVCVDTEALKTLVAKHAKAAAITLELVDGMLIVSGGRSRVKLPTLGADVFPTWADEKPVADFILPNADFVRAFERVRFAAAKDETRYYLQGVCLDYHDKRLHFVATDGHRIAVSGMVAPDGADKCPKVIVPSEGVDAALGVFKGVDVISVAISGKAVSFSTTHLRLSSRLIDGAFPAYERIIPERGHPGLTVRRADFVDCLDRANVFVGDGVHSSIVARPDGDTLHLDARAPGRGEAHEELEATIDDGVVPFGFNPRYVAEFLATLNVGALTIEQSDPNAPHLLWADDAPDFVGVIAPIQVAA